MNPIDLLADEGEKSIIRNQTSNINENVCSVFVIPSFFMKFNILGWIEGDFKNR